MEVDMTLIEVITSLVSNTRGGGEKYHQRMDNRTGVAVSVHINSLNGGSIVTKPLTHNIVLL
jgi:hypothetical protein